MTRLSKKRRIALEKSRAVNGTFIVKNQNETNFEKETEGIEDLEVEDWGNDDDSGWEEDIDLKLAETNRERLLGLELVWKKDAYLEKKIRGPYLIGPTKKSTFYDNYGPSGKWTKAAEDTPKLTNFFSLKNQEIVENETDDDVEEIFIDSEYEWNFKEIKIKIEGLKEELKNNQHKMSVIEYNKKRAIFEMLKRVKKNGKGLIKASIEAAELVFIESHPYKARCIRVWTKYWLQNAQLPPTFQGKHQKIIRLVDDEDIAEKCQTWIRNQGGHTTPIKFKEFVEQILLPETGITKQKTISNSTAKRWLNVLGFFHQQQRQGVYFDGHERDDVVEYRKIFLEEIAKYEPYMASYDGETMEKILPNLKDNEKEHIFVTHDECIFYSNDGKRGVWAKTGELPLRKKGNGRSIMISEFLTEACGRLKLDTQTIENYPHIPKEARVCLIPGKNQEGYWTMNHLLEQVKSKAIPIFEALFPNCIAIFAFDNSSNHAAFLPDALIASKMNLFPGGKQPAMRSTTWGENNHQDMCFPNDYFNEKLREKPKGMKQVLLERGKWKDSLKADCQLCKAGDKDPNRIDCCARRIISLESDFIAQKGALHEIISTAGHKCIFYPKFHCELNFIEMYWGATKKFTRENCDYSWAGLQKTVPLGLDSINLITIRKFARKAWRYMNVYHKGIGGKLAEYAVKKYKSHRRVPDNILEELNKIKF